jgi:hypothetical protein
MGGYLATARISFPRENVHRAVAKQRHISSSDRYIGTVLQVTILRSKVLELRSQIHENTKI